jgi:N-formylglutamate amidohydrolase
MSSVLTDQMVPDDVGATTSGDAQGAVSESVAIQSPHPSSVSPVPEQYGLGDTTLPTVVVGDTLFEDPSYVSFDIYETAAVQSAIVASCPHAGRGYPAGMLAMAAQPVEALRGLEDFGVDCLLPGLAAVGIPTLVNRVARAFLDVNRDASALDSAMFDGPVKAAKPCHHVRAGYGLIPKLTAARKPIYANRLDAAEASLRTAIVHKPYHAALQRLTDKAMQQHGHVLLVDFHSMPGQDRMNNALPDIIFGDGHGTTLDRATADAVSGFFKDAGLSVGWNHPYAGGHITRSSGDAGSARQALQIEINRNLYMDGPARLDSQRTLGLRETISAFGAFLITTFDETGTAARSG